jgi:rhamnulose-1-phosphate aldolase/alcohol dehydrogenase
MSKASVELLERSHRLGADPRNTNYGGGNTSAKGREVDPVTGTEIDVLWVKGSGGDLATLAPPGLAQLRLDRVRALVDVYPGEAGEDAMVDLWSFCAHGTGGAAPSIDTAMHGLVEAPHVDHLHPDAAIALACAADGAALTRECFGDRVLWVPWRRPGFQLGLDVAAIARDHPDAIGVILGGHGITAWGATSGECEERSLSIIRTAQSFLDSRGVSDPFGAVLPGYEPLPDAQRRARAAALAPLLRGLASTDSWLRTERRMVGHFTDSGVVLDFVAREAHPRLADLGTSCPDHFLRTKVKPMVLDLPPAASLEVVTGRLRELHTAYRADYQAYYQRNAAEGSPALRGADPAIVLVPGVGMFSFGKDAQTARIAGEYFVNAINAMRGAEAVSAYAPISEREKFRIEYWELEQAKLDRQPPPKELAGRVALVTGAGSGIGRATAGQLQARGAAVVLVDRDAAAVELATADVVRAAHRDAAVAVTADVTDEGSIAAAVAAAVLAYGGVDLVVNNAGLSISRPLLETSTSDWDSQHAVMARGSFLVSRETARVMVEQEFGGDIIYIVSKNSVFAGPDNIAYGATKADQAHQVRLLAAELGTHGIRVNGINPDGVVAGSGIFAGGWGAKRAALYGVPEEELGQFYAQRTLLKQEVTPADVAAAVATLAGRGLSLTTGLHVPVDSGVAAAFLR